MRVSTEKVVRKSKLERGDGLEVLDVLVGEGDLEGFDVILEVLDLSAPDCDVCRESDSSMLPAAARDQTH